ncbi:type II secretion system F family protein [Salinigranum marinum]|uniref:type II secretion system F family protein n=1 Tax=Salinigranum marinum TaxID=1515595 RepID=UPI002989AD5A|nr:type II secretion system F family protein [Salinigranum marinum]
MVLVYLPLVAAVGLGLLVALAPVSSTVDRLVSAAALWLFGDYVSRDTPRHTAELERMQAAHVDGTHRQYAARTAFVALVVGLVGSTVGIYVVAGALVVLSVNSSAIGVSLPPALDVVSGSVRPSIEYGRLLLFAAGAGVPVGAALAGATYWARWLYLDQVAQTRRNRIDASLPRTVAFVYALSRSGMPFPMVLETLADNQHVYGEAATELAVAVREMDTFGTDVVSALQAAGDRSPSEALEEFAENLSSVLSSGRSLSSFLHMQYERYQEEVEAQQEKYLDLLAAFAEIYVTVLVAGPLFFITVLVIIGLVISDTLPLIQFITYLGIPLATLAFVVYIDSITQGLRGPGWKSSLDVSTDRVPDRRLASTGVSIASDGGTSARARTALTRLDAYDRLEPVRRWLSEPFQQLLNRPTATVYFTLPLAGLWVLWRVGFDALSPSGAAATLGSASTPDLTALVAAVDEPLIEVAVFVLVPVSLVYELRKRRYRDFENATPDFLDRMASVNEAGLTAIESIHRVAGTDLGYLGDELQNVSRDISWGADVSTALRRMASRTPAPSLNRSMTLITNAMRVSGDISPVLRIAANETQSARRLRRERRQEMITYLLVIYLSFFVFLGIIVALTVSFIPAIEEAASASVLDSDTISVGIFAGLRDVQTEGYRLIFFHISVVQAVCSGLVAGQLGEGSVYDGLKHALVLLAVAYALFTFL